MALEVVKRTDTACRELADRHYSRQKPGAREFMGAGRTLVLRNAGGTVVYGWLYPWPGVHKVLDACWCTVFRNESPMLSSRLIREAELFALAKWSDVPRFATYVNPAKIASPNPGYCFKVCGYRHVGTSTRGLHLLVREL